MSTPSVHLPFRLGGGRARTRARAVALPRPELALLLVLAAVLDLWALSRNAFANDYYSAAVRSMSTSWHAFLYGSFDASGVMTVDKPPLALWVQALSVRVFGFNSWSLLVPQALMGIATVALAYDLTRRRFGRAAGFAAGLALATTPITVAISRHNNPDALLVLCVTAALWFVVRGLEDGRSRWIVLAGVCVGLGFEAKMGAALLVVPAIVAAWLWVAPRGRRTALRQLAAGGAAMTAVGLAWPLLVTLTPASDRPWIAGTSDNSIWSLILGYNGFGRLLGQSGGPGGAGGGPGGGGGGNVFFGGATGPLRLLNTALGGQDGWLLGLALVAGVAVVVASRLRRTDARTGWIIAVGGTFLITAVAFSTAQGIFHPYYVSQLAPFAAALVGAGAWQLTRSGRAVRLLGPLAIAGGVATELVVLHENPGQLAWLPPLLIGIGIVAAVALAGSTARRVRAAAVTVAFAVLLLAPATWAVQTLGHPTNGTFPTGGPQSAGMGGFGGRGGPGGNGGPGGGFGRGGGGFGPGGGRFGPGAGTAPAPGTAPGAPPAGAPPQGAAGGFGRGGGGFGGNSQALSQAVSYAQQHGGGTVAVSSQSGAAGLLIASGADIAGIGGFSGNESQVSVSWLANEIEAGHIRWVMTDGGSGGIAQGRVGSTAVMAAVAKVCTPVSSVSGLYDCSNSAAALRALGT
jgi:4-amino-4-deoxy-L-arabinose transferase-like glycosyltransferase